jgi:ribose transport system substrate-binding protein
MIFLPYSGAVTMDGFPGPRPLGSEGMRMRIAGWRIGASSVAVVLAVALAACGGGSGNGGSAGSGQKKLKIALSNSFIGNKWRIEMVNTFKAACDMPPYKDQVDCSVFSSGNDVSKQTQQISNLISEHVDAIVLDAASPTGLNGVVRQACQRHILVVSFDNIVTEPCALKVNTDQVQFGKELAQFLVDKLNGKGNVIMVTGVAGTSVDDDRNKGAMEVFKANPGIKVVGRYTGMWDSATAQRNTASQLPSLPKVDGIWAQGGTDGVIKAFIDAKRPVPPVAGEAENGFRKFMIGAEGNKPKLDAFSIGQPPYLVLIALEAARRILRHEYPRKNITVPFPAVDTQHVQPGKTVFPQIYDSFFTPFTDTSRAHTVHTTLKMVQTGEPSGLRLNVRLP